MIKYHLKCECGVEFESWVQATGACFIASNYFPKSNLRRTRSISTSIIRKKAYLNYKKKMSKT